MSQKSWYDIAHPKQDPFPPPYLVGFLNQHWVQRALGVPVNYSGAAASVAGAFEATGDDARAGHLEELAYLLDKGTKVALVYGDRDFACNWIGGERASLAIDYAKSDKFQSSGYTRILTNESYIGGQVRQYGNLSFSRVYQAGHEGINTLLLLPPSIPSLIAECIYLTDELGQFPRISPKLLTSFSCAPCSTEIWRLVSYHYGIPTKAWDRNLLGMSGTMFPNDPSQSVIFFPQIRVPRSNTPRS